MRRALGVALVVVLAAACASTPLDDMNVSDAQLQEMVQHALAVEPRLGGTHIFVSVNNGVVELSGQVQSDGQRELAGQVARGVEGARSVINNVHL